MAKGGKNSTGRGRGAAGSAGKDSRPNQAAWQKLSRISRTDCTHLSLASRYFSMLEMSSRSMQDLVDAEVPCEGREIDRRMLTSVLPAPPRLSHSLSSPQSALPAASSLRVIHQCFGVTLYLHTITVRIREAKKVQGIKSSCATTTLSGLIAHKDLHARSGQELTPNF
jgi:hypothetical protein